MSDIIGENRLSGQEPRFLSCGDTALCIEFGDSVDRRVSALVLALAHRVEASSLPGVIEMVPTFRSLLIHYDPLVLPQRELKAKLAPLLSNIEPAEGSNRVWQIPACYDQSLAPDLAEVAARIGMTPEQVAQRHGAATYHVYMVGFLPGYPYMGDLPPELALPRRENPRTKVPPGSIAIATTMTAVYPLESPGGWHLIGRTPVPFWDLRRDPPAILGAGDQVIFEPISLGDYESLQARVAAGSFSLEPAKPSQRGAGT